MHIFKVIVIIQRIISEAMDMFSKVNIGLTGA